MERGSFHSAESRQKMSAAASKRLGPKNSRWKGGRITHHLGYIRVLSPDHPSAGDRKYILEHRLVMEAMLGRYLLSSEIVHHKNGIRDDNRPENLELVVRKNHKGELHCPHCGELVNIA